MKFPIVALACAAHLPLNARPEANDRFNPIEYFYPTGCDNEQVARDASNTCKQPGEHNQQTITCWGCNWWGDDAHPVCEIQCCNDQPPVDGHKCGCTHAGESYKIGYDSEGATKCCGMDRHHHPKWSGDNCDCGDVGSRVKTGGVESDCCSGTMQNGFCVQAPIGKTAPGMRPQDCVTGHLHGDGSSRLCSEAAPGDYAVHPSHCMSGMLLPDNNCACVRAGNSHDNAEACCSGMHDTGTTICSCLPAQWNLHHGARARDCCSEKQHGGVCSCQTPGGPIKHGRGETGCCARHALEHDEHAHCGCAKPGTNLPVEKSGACCLGFYNHTGGKCACIPNGFLVAGFVEPDSCCSGHLEPDEHGGAHCAGVPEPPPAEPTPTEPEYQDLTGTYIVTQVEQGLNLDAYTTTDDASNDFAAVLRSTQENDSQKWVFTRFAAGESGPLIGTYTIVQKGRNDNEVSGRYLDAWTTGPPGQGKDFQVVTRDAQNNDSQRWVVTQTTTEGVYTIAQRVNGQFLDAHGESKDHKVVTRQFQNNDSQRWKLVKVSTGTTTVAPSALGEQIPAGAPHPSPRGGR